MLLAKDAIGMEEAINILISNNMKPSIRQLGNQKTLITKLVDGYSLMIKEDDSSPGYLCACLNSRKRGVVITWHEISHKSLALAIKYIQEQLGIGFKQKLFSETLTVVGTAVICFLLAGTSYVLISNKLAQCDTQQSEQPLFQP
jgi:hypothetical protein